MNRSLTDFDFELADEKIARFPARPRDHSKLLVDLSEEANCSDKLFHEIRQYLREGDLIVWNDSRVFPARIHGTKLPSGGRLEIFFLEPGEKTAVAYIRPAKRVRDQMQIQLDGGGLLHVKECLGQGRFLLEADFDGTILAYLQENGDMPIPPYVARQRAECQEDKIDYQTVYAGKKEGSVACPTAGLHFTSSLISDITGMGVDFASITLHVGPGTFRPVSTDTIEEHQMHEEFFEISQEAAERIEKQRRSKGRIIAVGTTVVRTLEHLCLQNGCVIPGTSSTDIFIREGHDFKAVDVLITNFHLPRSTLLMLVAAFHGYNKTMALYQHALAKEYRFYSFGDAMLLSRGGD